MSLERAWDFLSDPHNLRTITPDALDFRILSELPPKMYAGMFICYRIRPLLGLPMTWVTEITHVDAPHYFVDEQRVGPYRIWHHQHWLREHGDGAVEMEDIVDYALPFGLLGEAAHALMVRRQVEGIFDYRRKKLETLFPSEQA